jgi:hypothetical protein
MLVMHHVSWAVIVPDCYGLVRPHGLAIVTSDSPCMESHNNWNSGGYARGTGKDTVPVFFCKIFWGWRAAPGQNWPVRGQKVKLK